MLPTFLQLQLNPLKISTHYGQSLQVHVVKNKVNYGNQKQSTDGANK